MLPAVACPVCAHQAGHMTDIPSFTQFGIIQVLLETFCFIVLSLVAALYAAFLAAIIGMCFFLFI